MKVAVLFSGGKDSVFATFWAMNHGFEPILVTIKPPKFFYSKRSMYCALGTTA